MSDANSMQQRNNVLEADKAALNQQLITLKAEKASLEEQLKACQGKLSAGVSLPAVAGTPYAGCTDGSDFTGHGYTDRTDVPTGLCRTG